MTKEEKDLLLKDLCSRIQHGVKCQVYNFSIPYTLSGITPSKVYQELYFEELDYKECNGFVDIKHCKPYLFPLSSMTEEQKKECNFADDLDSDILDAALCTNHYHRTGIPAVTYNLVDWCTENNFDYRGLIPMGLANDATGLNIY